MKSTPHKKAVLHYLRKRWIRLPFSYIASFLMVFNGISPMDLMAIGGGPTSPEYQKPTAVNTDGLVDHFSGDVKYSVPLFEVGGYPVNLNYTGNLNMDQDAGWVGLGWSLNLGAITRGLRGLPDDFKGDLIEVEAKRKPHHFYDIYPKLPIDPLELELFGLKGFSAGVGLGKFHVMYDNYRGFGLGYGVNLKLGLISDTTTQKNVDSSKSKNFLHASLNFSTDYNSFDGNGYTFTPSVGMLMNKENPYQTENQKTRYPLALNASASMRINSEVGIQSAGLDIGASFPNGSGMNFGYSTGYNERSFLPQFDYDIKNKSGVLSLMLEQKNAVDKKKFGGLVQATITTLSSNNQNKKAYGYFYQNFSQDNNNHLVDCEQENKMLDDFTKSLPATVQTYDVFNISGIGIGGSFRGHYNSVGVIGPTQFTNTNNDEGFSLDGLEGKIELGKSNTATGFKIGADLGAVINYHKQEPWKDYNNDVAQMTSFKSTQVNQAFQGMSLRNVFEFIETDKDFNSQLGNGKAGKYRIDRLNVKRLPSRKITGNLVDVQNLSINTLNAPIQKQGREANQQVITYLTAVEAKQQGVRKEIRNYYSQNRYYTVNRLTGDRKAHHISEINVLQPNGVRYVFGHPVYNLQHVQKTFNVAGGSVDYLNGLSSYTGTQGSTANSSGVDHYYESKNIAPYAHSWLITEIFSPDYVDVDGNGPSDNDIGNYIEFHYQTKGTPLNEVVELYQWRTPYDQDKALFNPMQKSETADDKGNVSYGIKEQWYAKGIETKTHYVEFELDIRLDGHGVNGINGGYNYNSKQYYIKKITVYRKTTAGLKVEKTINLGYSYDLCKNAKGFYVGGTAANDHPLKKFMGSAYNNGYAFRKGKLTLHTVEVINEYASGATSRPYLFEYNTPNPDYAEKAFDRWGTYKPNDLHSINISSSSIDNISTFDYPYTKQDRTLTDAYAQSWLISDIHLPTGGKIKLSYESDDYAYVQNRKAMQMLTISGFSKSPSDAPKDMLYEKSSNPLDNKFINNDYIFFELPTGTNVIDFIPHEMDLLYFNFKINLAHHKDNPSYEHVTGYYELRTVNESSNEIGEAVHNGVRYGYVKVRNFYFKKEGNEAKTIPVATKMAWQYTYANIPKVFSPEGYTKDASDFNIRTVLNLFFGILKGFHKQIKGSTDYFRGKLYASKVNTAQSFIRVMPPSKTKLGGGHRVKEVSVYDNWNTFNSGANSAVYTTQYEYNMSENGQTFSSGVASYEPLSGGDENPFKMPRHYQAIKRGMLNTGPKTVSYDLDPIGEAFYPSASVGYRKVTVKTKVTNSAIKRHGNGSSEFEFYTAYDYPTRSEETSVDFKPNIIKSPKGHLNSRAKEAASKDGKNKLSKLKFGLDIGVTLGYAIASQGISIEVNDMHGKPKSVKSFAESSTSPISSTTYKYREYAPGRLKNKIDVLRPDGTVATVEAGVNIDPTFYATKAVSVKNDVGADIDLTILTSGGIPIPVPTVFPSYQMVRNEAKMFIYTKEISRVGILDSIIVTDKGATTKTHNVAWDALTGNVLLSGTKNEFGELVYNFSKPAHWMYQGMSGAYQNADAVLTLEVDANGRTTNPENLIRPGDELMVYSTNSNFWSEFIYPSNPPGNAKQAFLMKIQNLFFNPSQIAQYSIVSTPSIFWALDNYNGDISLINSAGVFVAAGKYLVKIKRSGNRNLLQANAEQITCIKNPIDYTSNTFTMDPERVLSASAITYRDFRQILNPIAYCFGIKCERIPVDTITNNLTSFGRDFYSNQTSATSSSGLFIKSMWDNYPEERVPAPYQYITSNYYTTLHYQYATVIPGSCYQPPPENPYAELFSYYSDLQYSFSAIRNPFVLGIRGVWNQHSEFVYYEKKKSKLARIQNETVSGDANTIDMRTAGQINGFKPFWRFVSNSWIPNDVQDILNPWTWKDSITVADNFGNGLESINALGIKNSILFGFNQKYPIATVANSKYCNSLYESFEDIDTMQSFIAACGKDINPSCSPCPYGPVNQKLSVFDVMFSQMHRHWPIAYALIANGNTVSERQSHTGRKSLRLGAGLTSIYFRDNPTIIDGDNGTRPWNKYYVNDGHIIKNFTTEAGKTYMLSVWVKETAYGQFSFQLKNQMKQIIPYTEMGGSIVVNGWRRVCIKFTLSSGNLRYLDFINHVTTNQAHQPCYLDDLRIHPIDAIMQSYVYDYTTFRIMATLDANNFATFMEYDSEGKLIRKKVETERGIFTIDEQRGNVIRK